jgi:hypothetical protein
MTIIKMSSILFARMVTVMAGKLPISYFKAGSSYIAIIKIT